MRPLEPGMAGVLAVLERPCGDRRRVGECASCERPMPLGGRGLCSACGRRHRNAGTIKAFGWVKADRLAEFAALPGDLTAAEAAVRLGVSARTIRRYKRDLEAS